jgi:mono/diheme cytochrome c family protein
LRAVALLAVAGLGPLHAALPAAAEGRLLYNELGCVRCHGGDTGLPARRGPDLTTATTRAQADWLRRFIADPAAHRAGSAMPRLFAGRDAAEADAVVHYLGTLPPKTPVRPKVIRHLNTALGRQLFHTRGCVACHAPESGAGSAPPAAGFPALGEKYVLATLADFLLDPLKTRPDGRMPRIALEEQEAVDLAAYLLGLPGSDGEAVPKLAVFTPDAAKAARGREVVQALRCAACHDLPGLAAPPPLALRLPDAGCLAPAPGADVPHYVLDAGQRAALRAYLSARDEPLAADARLNLTLAALNCTACHERDGSGGPPSSIQPYFQGDPNLGDTGRYPPPLTGAGRKLQPAWLARVLEGGARVRPYLKTAMPIYGEATAHLPALFAEADAAVSAPLPAGEVEAGRKLLGTTGGMGCITCHGWGGRASLGIPALDLATMADRLQPGWLRDYLIDPAAHRPGTLMPSFWPQGKSSNPHILGGDTARQIASILAFAREGRGLPEGFPSVTTREFELTPTDRPIVLRTFFADAGAGTHAILVGFPAGVHLAYDGRDARPALAWRGKFFDAYGTWFSRFAPFEKPLGESVVRWPAAAGTPQRRQFDGYRLDAAGVPTFLFSLDGVRVEERFEASANGLRRSVRWDREALATVPVAHPDGVTVIEAADSAPGRRTFTYTWQ